MRIREQLTAVGLVTTLLVTATVASASAAGPKTRYVDGDGHASAGDCNGSGHAFTHIQDAVDASGRNDTVIVCPGTYVGQVSIHGNRDGLTLKSSKPFGATIKAPVTMDYLYGTPFWTYLVYIESTDDVTVRGFKTVARTAAPCSPVYVTMFALASKRTQFRGNRLLAPGASPSRPCGQYFGIAAVSSINNNQVVPARSSSATIGFNEVRDAFANSLDVEGYGAPMRVDVVHNSVRAYYGQARTKPKALSTPVGVSQSGILALGVSGTIRENVIQGAISGAQGGPRFLYGITSYVLGSSARTLSIQDNLVRRAQVGLALQSGSGYQVLRNHIRSSKIAATLYGVTDSRIARNVLGATQAGLQVQASTGNTFARNTVTGSGGTCSDSSSGSGTGGTANHWTGNTATAGSLPAAICPAP